MGLTGGGRANPFPYASDNKRYHTLSYAMKQRFGTRVCKASLDAGLSCPNLDGTRGRGGCAYCLGGGAEFTRPGSISGQLAAEQERIARKHPGAPMIAYFQAHTNTYAPAKQLEQLYGEALAYPGVRGLSIATRADALPPEVLGLLKSLSRRTYLTVELGLQTVHGETARRINRGHSYQEFLSGYWALKKCGVRVCVHLINGLPGESGEMMLETARAVGLLFPDAVKLHLLHVLRGTPLANWYAQGEFRTLEREEYVSLVCSQLEWFPPETVMERLTGDGARETLLAPLWSRNKIAVLAAIDKELTRRDSWQGKALPAQK